MPIADISRILAEVASALGYAHAEGVAHRDIKPENMMFCHGGTAVVLDFGIGKAITASRDAATAVPATLTRRGQPLGTPMYMAPEQAAARPGAGPSRGHLRVRRGGVRDDRRPPALRGLTTRRCSSTRTRSGAGADRDAPAADAPPALAAIVMKCLEKEPAKRPQTARRSCGRWRGWIMRPALGARRSALGCRRGCRGPSRQ